MMYRYEIVPGFDGEQPTWFVLIERSWPSKTRPGFDFRQDIYPEATVKELADRDEREYGIDAIWHHFYREIQSRKEPVENLPEQH
jgi:hypothetical protein